MGRGKYAEQLFSFIYFLLFVIQAKICKDFELCSPLLIFYSLIQLFAIKSSVPSSHFL